MITTNEIKRIREDYAAGKKVEDISKEYGYHESTIYRYTKGVCNRGYQNRRSSIINGVCEAYKSGNYTIGAICQKYNISDRTVYNYLKLKEIERKNRFISRNIKITKEQANYILSSVDLSMFPELVCSLRNVVSSCE